MVDRLLDVAPALDIDGGGNKQPVDNGLPPVQGELGMVDVFVENRVLAGWWAPPLTNLKEMTSQEQS